MDLNLYHGIMYKNQLLLLFHAIVCCVAHSARFFPFFSFPFLFLRAARLDAGANRRRARMENFC